jgi:trk system potassium uptake protein TrkA
MATKQFAVLGLGRFGYEVAMRLTTEGCEVLAVDRRPEVVDRIRDHVTRSAIADVTDREALGELGVADLDGVIVALGGSLEGSILTCMHLKELGCKNITAKVMDADHEKILNKLGVPRVINPERETAQRLARHLAYASVLDYLPLAPGFSVMEVAPPPETVGKSLSEAHIRQNYNVQVVAIHELVPEAWRIIPEPGTVIKDSDVLVVLGRDEDLNKLAGKT